jgi:hypothetical protein
MIKSRRMRWARHVTQMREKVMYLSVQKVSDLGQENKVLYLGGYNT